MGWAGTDALLNSAPFAQCAQHGLAEFCAGAYRLFAHVTAACYNHGLGQYVVQVHVTESTCAIDQPVPACNQLPTVSGPCRARNPRWSYDAHGAKCVRFNYGGCEGNDNRFESRAQCEAACAAPQPSPTPAPIVDVCALPPFADGYYDNETGSHIVCYALLPMWSYDSDKGQCARFTFGGCGGNGNKFMSRAECEAKCVAPLPPPPAPDAHKCTLPPFADGYYDENGNHYHCNAYVPSWSYDSDKGQCVRFIFGGCGGNDNRFESGAECEAACTTPPPPPSSTPAPIADVCALPPFAQGYYDSETDSHFVCYALIPSWSYDTDKGQCVRFIYGGCGGNGNRFMSRAECEAKCKPTSGDHDGAHHGHLCGPRAGGKRFTCSITAVEIAAGRWRFDAEPPKCQMADGGATDANDYWKEEALRLLERAETIIREKL